MLQSVVSGVRVIWPDSHTHSRIVLFKPRIDPELVMFVTQNANSNDSDTVIVIQTVHGNVTSIRASQLRNAVAGRFEGNVPRTVASPSAVQQNDVG